MLAVRSSISFPEPDLTSFRLDDEPTLSPLYWLSGLIAGEPYWPDAGAEL